MKTKSIIIILVILAALVVADLYWFNLVLGKNKKKNAQRSLGGQIPVDQVQKEVEKNIIDGTADPNDPVVVETAQVMKNKSSRGEKVNSGLLIPALRVLNASKRNIGTATSIKPAIISRYEG